MASNDVDERESALTLLREQHRFPGPYVFRIVVRPSALSTVVSAVVAALGTESSLDTVDERLSRQGSYLALHLHATLSSAEKVLDVHEVVSHLDGVVMSL